MADLSDKEKSINKVIFITTAVALLALFGFIFYVTQGVQNAVAQEGDLTPEERQQLENELAELEQELAEIQEEVTKYSNESASYERDINIIESEIRGIRLEMQRNELIIEEANFGIRSNAQEIEKLNERFARNKELLGKLLLSIYKLDDTSSLEIFLATQSLSEFFNDVNNIKRMQEGMADTLDEIVAIKENLEVESESLEERLENHAALLGTQEIQQSELNEKIEEQEQLLEDSRTQEYAFREQAEQKRKSIQEVRSQIFRLEGAGIELAFGEAYGYAKPAAALVGIRPALLLSILKQESSWGANVGQCYLRNTETGEGVGVNTGNVMPRTLRASVRTYQSLSDVEAFLQITEETGRDPFNTRVSCWPGIYYQGQPYGYGGAMGPAQFIPTTWLAYRDSISNLLGRTADPWNVGDAFTASAYLLARNGATTHTYSAERRAALIYYAGGNWNSSVNAFYGNQVMSRAAEYQKDIDILEGN